MSSCPECGAALETPLGCAACGALLALPRNATPFELLALPLAFDVDRAEVERRVRRLGRLTHPDFFATRGADARARAESNTAALNAARETLLDDHARGDWLVRHLGGPDEGALRQMPQAFLAEVLEWNELLEEARRPPLDDTLRRRVVSLENELGERLARNLGPARPGALAAGAHGAQRAPLPRPHARGDRGAPVGQSRRPLRQGRCPTSSSTS